MYGRTSPTLWTGSVRARVTCEENGHLILIVRSYIMMVSGNESCKNNYFR